jgi:hypothetical protein
MLDKMKYRYFIPTIHLGPIKGTTFFQRLPLELISNSIIGESCILEVNREIICDGKSIFIDKKTLEYFSSTWVNLDGESLTWQNNEYDDLCYLETTINIIDGAVTDQHLPGYYVFYTNPSFKSYLSCGSYKYGNPRVILQIAEFRKWLDGYPCININREIDTTYSVIIINPYNRVSNIEIECPSLDIYKNIKVRAKAIERIDFANIIDLDIWSGQVYVYGSQRAIIYFVNHKISSFNNISTIEHPDPFRAERTKQPRLQKYRNSIHRFLKKVRGSK